MKNLCYYLLTISLFAFAACNKTSDGPPLPTVTLAAKINDTPWTATTVWSSKQTSSPIATTIGGEDTATAKSITLYLFDYNNTTGTFNADPGIARCAWNNNYSTSGVVVVTSTDGGYIKGKFNFITSDSTNITDGVFIAHLPQ